MRPAVESGIHSSSPTPSSSRIWRSWMAKTSRAPLSSSASPPPQALATPMLKSSMDIQPVVSTVSTAIWTPVAAWWARTSRSISASASPDNTWAWSTTVSSMTGRGTDPTWAWPREGARTAQTTAASAAARTASARPGHAGSARITRW